MPTHMKITHVHHNGDGPLIFLADDEPELQCAWDVLAFEEGTDTFAENAGEVWQYMGTSFQTDQKIWAHTFRHRCHPHSNRREYIYIPAILALTLDDLGPGPATYLITYTTVSGCNGGSQTTYGIYNNALLINYPDNRGARIHFRDTQLLEYRTGHPFLPRSIQLEWAREHATPAMPAFTFHVDPVDDEVFAYFRSLEARSDNHPEP